MDIAILARLAPPTELPPPILPNATGTVPSVDSSPRSSVSTLLPNPSVRVDGFQPQMVILTVNGNPPL